MSTRKGWQGEQVALRQRIRASQRGAGFTLLEILVALAIFVIGAVAIIRIFPPALGAIQGSENRTIATNTSRDVLARYASNPDLVPDSIYHVANYYGSGDIFAGAVSGTKNRNDSLPRTIRENAFEQSALGNVKRIVSEKHPILLDDNGTATSTDDRRYVITEYSHNGGEDADTPPNNVVTVFVEDTVVGARINKDGELDFTDARLKTLDVPFNERDYDRPGRTALGTTPVTPTPPDGPFAFEARLAPDDWRGPNSIYYVSYRYFKDTNNNDIQNTTERIQGIVEEPLILDKTALAAGARRKVVMARTGPAADVIPEEVSIRVKRQISSYTSATYAGAVPPLPGSSTATEVANNVERYSIRGFVPISNIPADLANGSQLAYSKVSVNYTVRDWRWMISNQSLAPIGQVDGTDAGIVTLPQRNYDNEHLVDTTSTNDSLTTVIGLLTSTSGSNTRFYTGQWNGDDTTTAADDERILTDNSVSAEKRDSDDYGVNSRKGIIRYNISSLTAPKARTAYWTLDGWAQQLSVAARSYIPYEATRGVSAGSVPAEREAWREYYWHGPNAGTGTGKDSDGRLYFPSTEAGKSVLVTFEYNAGGGDYKTKTAVYTINDEQMTPSASISEEDAAGDTVGVGPDNLISYAEIGDPQSGAPYDVTAILAVQGLSIQARTAWIEGESYQQASATGYRPINQS